jgi:hypothetical protein
MKRTFRTNLLGSDGADVVVDLSRITWPQSCCSGCGRIGSGIDPYRFCRCLEPYVTIHSPREYAELMAAAHAPREASLACEQASMPGWARRRAG